MPGIAGIIRTRPAEATSSLLQTMLTCLERESFYVSGRYVNPGLGLGLGWTYHRDSFSDCLPIWNETRTIALIFCGEEFGDPAPVEALRTRGHQFAPGNASYLVHLYEEKGLKFLEDLNGWFSGVLLDLQEDKIILFNDRYGFNRLYYYESPEGLYFASEAKSILRVAPRCRSLDSTSLAEFVSCGCALQNRTIFAGISLLPGGSVWTFRPNRPVCKESYFTWETWERQPILTAEGYYAKLKATFGRILPRYLSGASRKGMSLTGGLDGRMIMAWAGCPPGTLPCYTFGGSYRDCSDVRLARRVARTCHQPHQVIPVNGDFLSRFASLAEKAIYVSDGAMDVTGSVELYVNQMAREIAPIRLTGNYGSEILRGSVAFKPSPLSEAIYSTEFLKLSREATATYAVEARCHPVSFIAFKQVPWFHYARLSLEQSQITPRSPYLDNELVSLMYRAPSELILNKEPSLRLVAEGNAALARIPTDRGLLYRPVPVMTRTQAFWQELTVRAEYAYDYGMPQPLARIDRVFAPLHFERLFLGRHKFYHFRVWYRDKLAGYLKDVLLDGRSRSRTYLRGQAVEELVNRHVTGRANHTLELHQLLSLELIHRQLLEAN